MIADEDSLSQMQVWFIPLVKSDFKIVYFS